MQLRSQPLNMLDDAILSWLAVADSCGTCVTLGVSFLSVLAVLFHAKHALLSSAKLLQGEVPIKPVLGEMPMPFLVFKVERKRATQSSAHQRVHAEGGLKQLGLLTAAHTPYHWVIKS